MDKKILTGSALFFSNYEEFKSKDTDYIILTDDVNIPLKFIVKSTDLKEDLFIIKRESKEKLLDYFVNKAPFMCIGSLITPEFCKETGITIDDLKKLNINWDKLPPNYPRKYIKIIYDSYIENNDFTLTEEQRLAAYNSYKKARYK